jgi:uncharacterized protein (DUF2141 family)
MKRIVSFLVVAYVLSGNGFSQTASDNRITVEITNAVVNGGAVYLCVFSKAESFKKENPDIYYKLDAYKTSLVKEILLPDGEYVIMAFQDANNNQKLDYGLLGIPKELLAISNYSGKGYPSRDFNKQKIPVNGATGKITLRLYQL